MSAINPSNNTKNDMIVALVQKELKFSAILASLCTDVSAFAVKGAKQIEFPKLSSFTAGTRAFGVAGAESVITDTTDVLPLDKSAYLSYIIDTKSALQSSLSWELETAKRASSAHSRFVDNAVKDVLNSVGTPVGIAGDISKTIVLEMRKKLKQANADMNQVVLVVSAEQEAKLLNIDEFTRNDVYGSPVIMAGQVGRLYGIPCIVHNGLADAEFFMFEKSGVAIGWQSAPAYGEAPAIEYGVGSVKRAIDQLFGCAGMQLTAGLSPLVIKHGV